MREVKGSEKEVAAEDESSEVATQPPSTLCSSTKEGAQLERATTGKWFQYIYTRAHQALVRVVLTGESILNSDFGIINPGGLLLTDLSRL